MHTIPVYKTKNNVFIIQLELIPWPLVEENYIIPIMLHIIISQLYKYVLENPVHRVSDSATVEQFQGIKSDITRRALSFYRSKGHKHSNYFRKSTIDCTTLSCACFGPRNYPYYDVTHLTQQQQVYVWTENRTHHLQNNKQMRKELG